MLQNISALSFIKICSQLNNGMVVIVFKQTLQPTVPTDFGDITTSVAMIKAVKCKDSQRLFILLLVSPSWNPISIDTNYCSTGVADQLNSFRYSHCKGGALRSAFLMKPLKS